MPDGRDEKLIALASRLEAEGHRDDAHALRNVLGALGTYRAVAATIEDENARLRRRIAEILTPDPRGDDAI